MTILLVVLAVVVVLVVVVKRAGPGGPPVGSRAWEARMNLDLLLRVIEERLARKQAAQDPAERGRLEREIAFLSKQVDEQTAIADSGDRSPGKGYIGYTAYDGP